MDDLWQVARECVIYGDHMSVNVHRSETGKETLAEVRGSGFVAWFSWLLGWKLTTASFEGRSVELPGLLAAIRNAAMTQCLIT